MSKRVRLKDYHPTMKKLDEIFSLMGKLGIRIDVNDGQLEVVDDKYGRFQLNDNEDNNGGNRYAPSDLPPSFEFKLNKSVPE